MKRGRRRSVPAADVDSAAVAEAVAAVDLAADAAVVVVAAAAVAAETVAVVAEAADAIAARAGNHQQRSKADLRVCLFCCERFVANELFMSALRTSRNCRFGAISSSPLLDS